MAWPSSSARTKNWGTEILTDADLEAQLDLLHTYFNDSLNASTGHGHTGGTADGPKISLTAAVQGTLPLGNGGTGQTTLAGLLNLVYPVGTVLTFGVSTNPATLLGFGTWTAIEGKVIVGISASDTEFDTLNETGGSKTVDASHTHTGTTGTPNQGQTNVDGSSSPVATQNHTHNFTTSSGGSSTQNNLQPYIVKYVWERTA